MMDSQERSLFRFYFIGVCVVSFLLMMAAIASAQALQPVVDTSKAVIHHTASGCWTTVEDIRKWHVEERGWQDVGYHKIILCNGNIEEGRSIGMQGAHAKGRNGVLGIALVGNDKFTQAQIDSLKRLIKEMKIKQIEPHHEQCPGPGLNLGEIR